VRLHLSDLRVQYGRILAVRGISLAVQPGELVCIVGPNGAGKTSTLRSIAGVVPVAHGDIALDGESLAGLSPERRARHGLALVPEGRSVFATLSVRENLLLGTSRPELRAGASADLERMLMLFPSLRVRLTLPAGRLSGGEQQQLAIARALMTRPKLLLIDEPSLGLSPQVVDLVFDLLAGLREQGATMLLVEQSIERAIAIADRIYIMRSGRIELEGTAAELEGHRELHEAYFGFSED
jgi:branched-chain amino acid transport system ATP-binding protein